MSDNTEQIGGLRDQIECIELSDDEMDLNSGQSGSGRVEDNQTNDDGMEVDPQESNSVRSERSGRIRRSLTIQSKLKMVEEVKAGASMYSVVKKYGISHSMVIRYIRNGDKMAALKNDKRFQSRNWY